MNETLAYSGNLVVETCWCGIAHAVPQTLRDHMKQQQNDGQCQTGIFCPLGHSWIFSGKGEAEIEKERRVAAERATANAEEAARILAAELAQTKAAAKKAAQRAKGGACPCCNRTFVQLTRHMATKHPNFQK